MDMTRNAIERTPQNFSDMHIEILTTATPPRELLLLADESEASVADYIDRDYFLKYYPDPIFENGVACRHMIRFCMEFD